MLAEEGRRVEGLHLGHHRRRYLGEFMGVANAVHVDVVVVAHRLLLRLLDLVGQRGAPVVAEDVLVELQRQGVELLEGAVCTLFRARLAKKV